MQYDTISENAKKQIIYNFLNTISKKFSNCPNNLEQMLLSREFFVNNLPGFPAAQAFPSGNVAIHKNVNLNDDLAKHIINHELFHLISMTNEIDSKSINGDSYISYFSTYGYIDHFPEEYLRELLNSQNFSDSIEENLEKFKAKKFSPCFTDFEEACTEFLTSYVENHSKSRAVALGNTSLYILRNGFPSEYDINVSMIDMLSIVSGIDKIFDMQVGNITMRDFFEELDSKYSDCMNNSNYLYPGWEILSTLNDNCSSNYIKCSTLMMRMFHKYMNLSNISSISDLSVF